MIGWSYGGAVAVALAARYPQRVVRLVNVEGNLDPDGPALGRQIATQTEDAFVSSGYQALVQQVRAPGIDGEAWAASGAGAWQSAAPHALYHTAVGAVHGAKAIREQFLQGSLPRAYIFGEHSLPNPDADYLQSHGIPLHIVPKAGHFMVWENPAGVAEVLARALTP